MVDGYANCIYNFSPGGGWRYVCGDFDDNSTCQWAAIGIIAATHGFGAPEAIRVTVGTPDELRFLSEALASVAANIA